MNKAEQNKWKIKARVWQMVTDELISSVYDQIDRALDCGAIDPEQWSEDDNPMILPKIILIAILENEADQIKGKGTSFEKHVRKEVKNLKLFI